MPISRGVELLEDLRQLLSVADVHEMLHEVTESSLLNLVLCAECPQVGQSTVDLGCVLTSLSSVLKGFAHIKPWVMEGFLSAQAVTLSCQELRKKILCLVRDMLPVFALH